MVLTHLHLLSIHNGKSCTKFRSYIKEGTNLVYKSVKGIQHLWLQSYEFGDGILLAKIICHGRKA